MSNDAADVLGWLASLIILALITVGLVTVAEWLLPVNAVPLQEQTHVK